MGIVSYAQNFEDVMLWRALGHIERGSYIDVGAQDPTVDSVSKTFYEHGWRGIHVEPAGFYADLMRKDRPDELVIQAAIAQQRGLLRFFEIPDTGMSTASPDIAEQHRQQGHTVRETTVTALTLDDVFALAEAGGIHWLKIDVEGFEKEVLSGWRKSAHRPWIIVIESTYPNSQQETHQAWESQILAKGYTLAYVDGLNRYYLADAHEELKETFRFGPNLFDGFQLTESSWSAGLIKQRYEEKLAGIDRQRTEVENQVATLRETLARAEAGAAEREDRLRGEAEQELEAARAEAQQAVAEQSRIHSEREQVLQAELAALRETLARAEAGAAEGARRLREAAEQKLEAARTEAQAQLQQLGGRERAFAEQLVQVQSEARQAVAEQSRIHGERERVLQAELDALRETLARAEAGAAEDARRLREEAKQRLEAARTEAQAHLQQLGGRERAFAEQLVQVQSEARQAVTEQGRIHGEREQVQQAELAALRETLARAEAGAAGREERLREAAEQRLEAARAEAQAHLQQLGGRERAFAEQLVQVQGEAQKAVAEQGRIHGEREQALQAKLAILREALARAEAGAAEREGRLREAAEQRLEAARAEAQAHLRQLGDRDSAFAEQLAQVQSEAQQAVAEQSRIHSEREQVLRAELDALHETLARAEAGAAEREGRLREAAEQKLESARAEAQAHLQQLGDRERASSDQLSQIQREAAERQSELNAALLAQDEERQALQLQLAELNDRIEAARNLEAALRADLTRQAGQTATIAAEIARRQRTFSRRLTAPLRKLAAIFGQQANDSASGQPTGFPISIPDPESLTPPPDNATPAESIVIQPSIVSPAMPPATDSDEIPAATTLDELLSLYDAAFVHCAYRTLLGREPDPAGLGYYLARVRGGVSRRQILAQLRLSAEGRAHGARLAGLDKAIRRYRWLNQPVGRALLRTVGLREHRVDVHRKLRAIENAIFSFEREDRQRFARVELKLAGLQDRVLQQVEGRNIDSITAAAVEPTAQIGGSAIAAPEDQPELPVPASIPAVAASDAAPQILDTAIAIAPSKWPRPRGERVLYYYVDHTIACPVNTGMQRLARRLGRALVERGDTVRFVKWKAEEKKFTLINRDELAHLSQWNGPSLKPSELRLYPSQTEDAPALDIGDAGQDDWLLVPEVTHITYQEKPVTLDVVMEARRLGARVAFIYYDAIPLRLQEYKEAAAQHEEYMQALLLADAIFPISNRSAEELKAFFVHYQKATSIPRVQALQLSGETGLSPRVTRPRDNLHDSRIILSVGSIEPRKNQLKLIEAFEHFSALPQGQGWQLVLAGHLRADVASVVHAALQRNPNIQYVQHPSDEQLDSLYRSASFTAFPSVEEGFGLPILESLWYSAPCICANFGAMGEVAEGGGCLAVDTTRVEEIFGAIVRLSGDSRLLAELSRQATTRAITGWSEYAQKISSLLTRSNDFSAFFRDIYYWVDDTASNAHNSGIQRVVRQLARALIASGINLIPVKWDSANKRMRHAVDSDLMHLAKWNGPNPGDWGKWVDPSAIEAPGWLLIPELVHGVLGDVKRFVESANMRCAAIFYDAIPYKLKSVFPAAFAEAHARYMRDLASFDRVFAISQFSFDDLRQFLLSSRIRCHSFDHRFKPVPLPTQFVEYGRGVTAKKSDDEIIRVLAVISVEPRKNPLVLLDAFSKAAKASSRRLVLTLVGRRIEYFSSLAEEVTARLRDIPGATWERDVDDVRLRELYEQADFTVFPSLEEGFGLPIVESIWNARPCIVHNSGSMTEIAENGGCVQVDMRDVAALADAILTLAEGDELRERVAKAAIAHPVRTWGEYAKEIVTRLATDRKSDCVERIAAIGNVDIYKELPNLKPRPALSVCISTYNRGPWLRLNLQNLFAQIPDPVDDIEVLVVDNASTDNTAEVVATYAGRKDFRYVRNRKNVGMLGNLTVTAHQARGDYIWILGDDDLLKPNAIRRVMKVIKDHPDVALVYLNYAYTYEKDPSNIGNVAEFLDKCPAIVAPGGDQYSPAKQIVTKNENLFTAIYCLVLRRDHAIRAYSQNTGGRPFATMRTSVPTTYYVLNYMMDESAYWIGDPVLVVNFNVSWNQYASLQILERVPEALDLAERLGADSPGTDRWRENIVPGFAHYWREMYESDTMGNSAFFAPERLVMRMKHLDAFASIVPPLAEIYERAHRAGHPAAQAPASSLFCAFNVEGAA